MKGLRTALPRRRRFQPRDRARLRQRPNTYNHQGHQTAAGKSTLFNFIRGAAAAHLGGPSISRRAGHHRPCRPISSFTRAFTAAPSRSPTSQLHDPCARTLMMVPGDLFRRDALERGFHRCRIQAEEPRARPTRPTEVLDLPSPSTTSPTRRAGNPLWRSEEAAGAGGRTHDGRRAHVFLDDGWGGV